MPDSMQMNTVVVFGDSLSDIGRKWKTKAGKLAILANQMFVNSSGRFSDCRNWTDHMIEAATGQSLVAGTASATIALSKMHMTLTSESMFSCENSFQYVNYAEGGACGYTPASKRMFLGTFKEQVDLFETDLHSSGLPLGNTLFIIWFGANDLYTASRAPMEMNVVADEIANTQRNRLVKIVKSRGGQCRFIFVNLARALTAVRYQMEVTKYENSLMRAFNIKKFEPIHRPTGALWHAQQTISVAVRQGGAHTQEIQKLQEIVDTIKGFEAGVMNFNTALAAKATRNGDAVAEIGNVISEEVIRRLVEGHYGLVAGAMNMRATHVSSFGYDTSSARPLATIDKAHPTDPVYKLVWEHIYEEIKKSRVTFGKLVGTQVASTLEKLSGPSNQVRGNFAAVLGQIGARGEQPKGPPTLRRTGAFRRR